MTKNDVAVRARAYREKYGKWGMSHAETLCNEVERLQTELTQLRGNLSLAEDGLAAAMQEQRAHAEIQVGLTRIIDDMTTQRDHWLEIAREKDRELELLEIERAAAIDRLTPLGLEVERLKSAVNKALEWCYKENVYGHVRNELEIANTSSEPRAYCPNCDCDYCGSVQGRLERAAVPHSTEDDFRHFLSYSKLSGQPDGATMLLRLAYYAGADVKPPAKSNPAPEPLRQDVISCRNCGTVFPESGNCPVCFPCKTFVGDGPTYSCLLCGRLGTEHAQRTV